MSDAITYVVINNHRFILTGDGLTGVIKDPVPEPVERPATTYEQTSPPYIRIENQDW